MTNRQVSEVAEAIVGFGVIITWALSTAALIKFIFFM